MNRVSAYGYRKAPVVRVLEPAFGPEAWRLFGAAEE
jgi:hypothetical protein